ncbi:Cas4 exonuclease [Mycobacterium phage BuzzBuzz]|uniref:Cas4 exonuclease n=3 Tax=Mycobacterium phage Bxz2 TaxID=205870 RepID=A0A1B1SFN6_BPMB2|nr:Cas4 exonuclease [Mycobacterium phage BuzzBuzz]AOZ64845.1 Cas4 exonuclease [Mycobacterium phage Louie6]ASM62491.1 Cas4 exonuclease [Mycobacterium phage KADY]AXH47970.1 Cas4 exonuclease [Mycobacterium phage Misomonster]
MTDTRKHRSVSQLKQYERCPYSYKLARVDKVWQRPAAWLPQGSAVHTVLEEYRRRELDGDPMSLEEAQEMFKEEYAKEVSQYTDVTPNFDWWFRSGRYDGASDLERRWHIGLEQIEKFFAWTEGHPEEVIWIAPDGTPGIELGFDIDLDGVLVRGYIDAVLRDSDGNVIVRDYKTGNTPGDDFQLGVYSVALAETYGIEPPQIGDYYMAGKKGVKGKPTYPYDLGDWPRERVAEKFRELEENIAAERFDPDPDPDKCAFCDVSYHCPFAMG